MFLFAAAWESYSNIHEAKEAMEEFWKAEEADREIGECLINRRVAVYFPSGAKGWYNGTIVAWNEETKEGTIKYDDTSEDEIVMNDPEEWEWKKGEYKKNGQRKPPKIVKPQVKKVEPEIPVPQMSLPDMTTRFTTMMKEKMDTIPSLCPTFNDHEAVLDLRRAFAGTERNAQDEFPMPDGKFPEEFVPAIAALAHENIGLKMTALARKITRLLVKSPGPKKVVEPEAVAVEATAEEAPVAEGEVEAPAEEAPAEESPAGEDASVVEAVLLEAAPEEEPAAEAAPEPVYFHYDDEPSNFDDIGDAVMEHVTELVKRVNVGVDEKSTTDATNHVFMWELRDQQISYRLIRDCLLLILDRYRVLFSIDIS